MIFKIPRYHKGLTRLKTIVGKILNYLKKNKINKRIIIKTKRKCKTLSKDQNL